MEVISGLGCSDPLRHHPSVASIELSEHRDGGADVGTVVATGAGHARGMQPQRVRGLQRQRRELRIRRDGQLPDDDHDAATCHDHHCRTHWTDITRRVYDPATGRITA